MAFWRRWFFSHRLPAGIPAVFTSLILGGVSFGRVWWIFGWSLVFLLDVLQAVETFRNVMKVPTKSHLFPSKIKYVQNFTNPNEGRIYLFSEISSQSSLTNHCFDAPPKNTGIR